MGCVLVDRVEQRVVGYGYNQTNATANVRVIFFRTILRNFVYFMYTRMLLARRPLWHSIDTCHLEASLLPLGKVSVRMTLPKAARTCSFPFYRPHDMPNSSQSTIQFDQKAIQPSSSDVTCEF